MSKLSKRKVALYKHLLYNGTLSIKTAYTDFGISNISREVRRLIEIPLDTELKRVLKKGATLYGEPCYWFEYSASDMNKIALKKALEGEMKHCCSPASGFYLGMTCPKCNRPFRSYNIHTVSK